MKIENEILVNKFGQDLVDVEQIINMLSSHDYPDKRFFMNEMIFLIAQSKPKDEDILPTIAASKLKERFTPCIILKKGVASHNLQRIASLPDNEVDKAILLLLNLYKVAYRRRFETEKNHPNKWWYWDLSNEDKVQLVLENNRP